MAHLPIPPTSPPPPAGLPGTWLQQAGKWIAGPARNFVEVILTTVLVGIGLHTTWMHLSIATNDYFGNARVAPIQDDQIKTDLLVAALPDCSSRDLAACLSSPSGASVMARSLDLAARLARHPDNPAAGIGDTRRALAYAAAQAVDLVDEASDCTRTIARQIRKTEAAAPAKDAARRPAGIPAAAPDLAEAAPGLEPGTIRKCAFAWSVIWQVSAAGRSAGSPGQVRLSGPEVIRHVDIAYALLRAHLALLPRDDGAVKMAALVLALDNAQASRSGACSVPASATCAALSLARPSPDGGAVEIARIVGAGAEPAAIYGQLTKEANLKHHKIMTALVFVVAGVVLSKALIFGMNKWILSMAGTGPP